MKILYTNFHKGAGGGHTSYVLSLIGPLSQDHQIVVAAPAGSELLRRAAQVPGVTTLAQDFPNRLRLVWRAARALRACLIAHQIDVVHVNGSADHRLVMLARLGMGKRRPAIVFTKHNDQRIKPASAWFRARFGTQHVIAVCDFVRRRLDATAYRRTGITTIANGVDTTHYDRDALLADPDMQNTVDQYRQTWLGDLNEAQRDRPLIFGSQAGTYDYKGWMDLVHAVANLPAPERKRVRIALAGTPLTQAQQRELDASGIADQVFFVGLLQDVRPFLAALDLGFVLSWRVETISFACREMMAMGLPVMVSDHGGLPENIIPGENGWIVPARDVSAIGRCVSERLAQFDTLKTLGMTARDHARARFGLTPFVQATLQVYIDAMRVKREPGPAS